jgi:hypothetical protein
MERIYGRVGKKCKPCNNIIHSEYRRNNPEQTKDTIHKSYMKNRKKRLEYGKQYREKKKEEKI